MEKIIYPKKNGLELISITSVSDDFVTDDLRKSLTETIIEKSFVVLYLDYKVLIGTYENGDFLFYKDEKFEDKFVQRIRVFNEKEEFFAWRSNGKLKCRYRTDAKGEQIEAVDAYQVLFGTDSKPLDNYTKISEDRGTELIVPFKNLDIDIKKDKKKRIFIKSRNYIHPNDTKPATYFDCRFVGFSIDQKTLLKIKE